MRGDVITGSGSHIEGTLSRVVGFAFQEVNFFFFVIEHCIACQKYELKLGKRHDYPPDNPLFVQPSTSTKISSKIKQSPKHFQNIQKTFSNPLFVQSRAADAE